MGMRPNGFTKMMGFFLCSSSSLSCNPSCFSCTNSMEASHDRDGDEGELEAMSLVKSERGRAMRLKDALLSDVDDDDQTLAFQLKPKTVTLRVSMHCYGCARKVEKHISKMDGVTSYKVDLESKIVIVTGDIFPYEVLQSVSRVKNAELWIDSPKSIHG